jgi:hypothetical protein
LKNGNTLDKSILADAKRFRWILNGNGYFMEEQGLCPTCGTDEKEKDRARELIDDAMNNDEQASGKEGQLKIDSFHPEFENFIRAFWRRI